MFGPSDFTLRYNVDGSLDSSFGQGGLVTTDFGGNDTPYGISLQSDWQDRGRRHSTLRQQPRFRRCATTRTAVWTPRLPRAGNCCGGTSSPSGPSPSSPTARSWWRATPASACRLRRAPHPNGTLDAAFGDHGEVRTSSRRLRVRQRRRPAAGRQDRPRGFPPGPGRLFHRSESCRVRGHPVQPGRQPGRSASAPAAKSSPTWAGRRKPTDSSSRPTAGSSPPARSRTASSPWVTPSGAICAGTLRPGRKFG